MSDSRKAAIIEITPESLRALLQLPEGAEVVRVEADPERRGALRMVIHGAGWETPEGRRIRTAPAAIITEHRHADGEVTKRTIDWRLGEEAKPMHSRSVTIPASLLDADSVVRVDYTPVGGEPQLAWFNARSEPAKQDGIVAMVRGMKFATITGQLPTSEQMAPAIRSVVQAAAVKPVFSASDFKRWSPRIEPDLPEVVRLPVRDPMQFHEVKCSSKDAAFLESEARRKAFWESAVRSGFVTREEAVTEMRAAVGLTKTATDGERSNGRMAWMPGA